MPLGAATYDESGELVSGVFYELEIPGDLDLMLAGEPVTSDWILRRVPDPNRRYVWVDIGVETSCEHRCSRDKSHVTAIHHGKRTADVFGGPAVSAFVPTSYESLIVNGAFWRRLSNSGLTGIRRVPLKVGDNQSENDQPDLWEVFPEGRDCLRKGVAVIPPRNTCPYCGWGPVVCPECRTINGSCGACGKDLTVPRRLHKGPNDKRYVVNRIPEKGRIIDVARWDGRDFISGGDPCVVTRRSIEFFLQEKAAPLIARPCRADIRGMSDEQRKWLLRAAGSLGDALLKAGQN